MAERRSLANYWQQRYKEPVRIPEKTNTNGEVDPPSQALPRAPGQSSQLDEIFGIGSYDLEAPYSSQEHTSSELPPWDYKTANETPERLGPAGEQLPPGALGWTPQGEHYFGTGLSGLWNKLQSRWNEDPPDSIPFSEIGKPTKQKFRDDLYHIATHGLSVPFEKDITDYSDEVDGSNRWMAGLNAIGELLDWATGQLMRNENADTGNIVGDLGMNVFGKLNRMLRIGTEMVFDAFETSSNLVEMYLMYPVVSLKQIAERSDIPEFAPGNREYDEYKKFMEASGEPMPEPNYGFIPNVEWDNKFIETVRTFGPLNTLWNWRRGVAADISKDEKERIVNDAREASRIAYTAAFSPAIQAEYLSRYRAGEDPYLLALELGDPTAELAGKLIYDPLMVLDLWNVGRYAKYGLRNWRIRQQFVDVAPEVKAILGVVGGADEAVAAGKFDDLATAAQVALQRRARWTKNYSEQRGLFDLLADGKRDRILRSGGSYLEGILQVYKNPDDVTDILEAVVKMTSDNLDEVKEAIVTLAHADAFPMDFYFSNSAQDAGVLLRKIMEDKDGVVNTSKFLDDIAKKGDDIGEFVSWMDKKIDNAAKALYPNVQEAIKNGDYVGPLNWLLEKVSRPVDSVYRPVNKMFANLYMGLNEAYALRNLTSNSSHVLADWGVVAAFESTVAQGVRPIENVLRKFNEDFVGISGMQRAFIEEWTGGIMPSTTDRGFSMSEIIGADVRWPTAKQSEAYEQAASLTVAKHAVQESMLSQLMPGRALGNMDELVELGVDAASLRSLVIEHKGDLGKVRDALIETGDLAALKLHELLPEVMDDKSFKFFARISALDDIGKIIKGGGTLDEVVDSIRLLQSQIGELADTSSRTIPGINLNNADQYHPGAMEVMEAIGRATDAGYLPPTSRIVKQAQITQNSNAMSIWMQNVNDALRNAVREMDSVDDVTKDTIEMMLESLRKESVVATTNQIGPYEELLGLTWDLSDAIKYSPSGSAADYWDAVKALYPRIVGDLHPNLTKKGILDILWDVGFREDTTLRFAKQREAVASIFRKSTEMIFEMVGSSIKHKDKLNIRKNIRLAEEALENARLFDNAVYIDGYKHLPVGMKENFDGILRLSRAYGLPTVTAQGAYNPRLLATINKFRPEDVPKFTSIYDVPFEMAKDALAQWAKDKGKDVLEVYSDDLDVLMRKADDVIAPGVLDDAVDDGVDIVGDVDEVVEQPTNLQKIFAGFEDAPPSYVDMLHANRDGTNGLFDNLVRNIEKKFGKTIPKLSIDQSSAIDKWLTDIKPYVNQARVQAVAFADSSVDFALHNYNAKYGFDKLLAYIYPYQFWHTRTYSKWFTQRVFQNPGLIAGYAKYRDALEKQHAGSPEWWRYNVNTHELFGADPDDALYFNLAASIDPLYQLTGADFNDRNKRLTWWTALLDDAGKVGPSTHTMLSLGTALALKMQGDNEQDEEKLEAAARWGGRFLPQSQPIESALHLLGYDYSTVDPAVALFSDGQDVYEEKRIGRALTGLIGKYTESQVIEAGYNRTGAIWDEAVSAARDLRAGGNLASSFLGTGYKARTQHDIEIDTFYEELFRLTSQRNNYSPDEYRDLMNGLRNKYEFMDTLLLVQKSSNERDSALAYNALARVPPAQSDEIFEVLGVSEELVQKFHDSKGDMTDWPDADKSDFMSGIMNIATALEVPSTATRNTWIAAKNAYRGMTEQREEIYGDDGYLTIDDRIGVFYNLYAQDPEKGRTYLEYNPNVQDAMEWTTTSLMSHPILVSYYGGIEKLSGYMKGQKWEDIESKLGPDIWDKWDKYYNYKDYGDEETEVFLEERPWVSEILDLRSEQKFLMEDKYGHGIWNMWDEYGRIKDEGTREERMIYWSVNEGTLGGYMDDREVFEAALVSRYGEEALKDVEVYFEMTDSFDRIARRYFHEHPELETYIELRDEWDEKIAQEVIEFAGNLPKSLPANVREDANLEAVGAMNLAKFVEDPNIPQIPQDMWKEVIDEKLYERYLNDELKESDMSRLAIIAETMNVAPEMFFSMMQESLALQP